MTNQKEPTFTEFLRYIIGLFLPEIGRLSSKIVQRLPEEFKHPWIAAALSGFAQFVEKQNLRGLEESLSDLIETFARALRDEPQAKEPEEEKLININKLLENIKNNLLSAKTVEEVEEQRKIALATIEALREIGESLVELDKILYPQKEEEKTEIKIEWDKILTKLQKTVEIIKENLVTNLPNIYDVYNKIITKIGEEYKRIDKEWAQKIEEARKKVKKWPRPF